MKSDKRDDSYIHIMPDYKCQIVKAINKLRPMSKEVCLRCKSSRLLCGRPSCPLLAKLKIQSPLEDKLKEDIYGPSPGIFVGHRGYPDVFIGPLTTLEPELAEISDNPNRWYGFDFNEIIKLRSTLVRSKSRQNVKEKTRLVEKSQEIALSVKPTYTEISFERKPSFSVSFSTLCQPQGPVGLIKKFDIAGNTKIPEKVDSVVGDEISSTEAAMLLFKSGYDVYYVTKVLSSGVLGREDRKKLVPTRWSITATDDILGKAIINEIKDYPVINEYRVYSNTYLDNHFEILLLPRKWEYEQFEAWAPNTLWTLAMEKPAINYEYEGYHGRSNYAEQEGGGYYAARFGVLEAIAKLRKQACAVVFREIYEGYIMPVGVWEVRENVRKAMASEPYKYNTLNEALNSISKRLKIPMNEYLTRTRILRQRRLEDFLNV